VTDLTGLDDSAFDDADDFDALDALISDEVRRDPTFAEGLSDVSARRDVLGTLIEWRKSAGLTQAAVASAMGTTQSAVSDLESGGRDLLLSTLQRYARAVGAHLDIAVSYRASSRPVPSVTAPRNAQVYALEWTSGTRATAHRAELSQQLAASAS